MIDPAFDLALAELLAARLCHELVSPIGAIANGVEILEDEPEYAADATRLLAQSARDAARRLQFYRVAYGATAALDGGRARIATLEFFAGGKIVCDWPAGLPPLPAGWQKLACNLLLLAGEALPRGGRVTLAAAVQGGTLAAIAAGPGARLADPMEALLRAPRDGGELTPRSVQAAFTAILAERLGARIEPKHAGVDALALVVTETG